MTIERKSCAPNIKAVAPGSATVVIATLNVVDKDNDVILPGFFGEQVGSLKPAHDWSNYDIGKAWVREESNEALAELKFNLATTDGKDWHAAVKFDYENPPAVQEYSFGFRPREGSVRMGEFAGRQVRFLGPLQDGTPGVDLVEVSPVTRGAGQRTRTMTIKEEGQDAEPSEGSTNGNGDIKRYTLEQCFELLNSQIYHLGFVHDMRSEDGKKLADETIAMIDDTSKRFDALRAKVKLAPVEHDPIDEEMTIRYQQLSHELSQEQEVLTAQDAAENEALFRAFSERSERINALLAS